MANEVRVIVSAQDKTGPVFGKMRASVAGAAAALGGAALVVTKFFKDSAREAIESNKVMAQTNAVLKSTSGAAGVTAKQVDKLATSISRKTGIDDEAIASGENMLLTFTNIRNAAGKNNDIFTQSTKIITDMSVALGQDMKTSAIQVGKALNDPVKGMTALKRVGVTFNEEQVKTITNLQKQGKTMEAQKIILKELRKEFGGSAEAQANWLDKAKVGWSNLQETVGKQFLPAAEKVGKTLAKDVFPALEKVANDKGVKRAFKSLGDDASAFLKNISKPKNVEQMADAISGLADSIEETGKAAKTAQEEYGKFARFIDKHEKKELSKDSFLLPDKNRIKEQWAAIRKIYAASNLAIMRMFDKTASAGAKLGIVPKEFAAGVHKGYLAAKRDYEKTVKEHKRAKDRIENDKIEAKLKADNRDAKKKYRETKHDLNDKDLTKERRAHLKAENKQARETIRRTRYLLQQLDGYTARTYIKTTYSGINARNAGAPFHAAGGNVSAAASGGPKSNLVQVGERGPELVALPTGSHVFPNGNSTMGKGGGRGETHLHFHFGNVWGSSQALIKELTDAKRRGQLDVLFR